MYADDMRITPVHCICRILPGDQVEVVIPQPVWTWIDMVGRGWQARGWGGSVADDVIIVYWNVIFINQVGNQFSRP